MTSMAAAVILQYPPAFDHVHCILSLQNITHFDMTTTHKWCRKFSGSWHVLQQHDELAPYSALAVQLAASSLASTVKPWVDGWWLGLDVQNDIEVTEVEFKLQSWIWSIWMFPKIVGFPPTSSICS